MIYNSKEKELIIELFDHLTKEDIVYVIPRGYTNLPEEVLGGDIDIYVCESNFQDAIKCAESLGFAPSDSGISGIVSVAKKALREPSKAVQMIVTEPRKVFALLESEVKKDHSTTLTQSDYVEWKGYNSNVMIHLMNHVAYESPLNGSMVRVDPTVERSLFNNRKRQNGIPIPDEPDELAHLICRGIYSKRGEFPEYYIEKCDQLMSIISSSKEKEKKFRELLSLIFFDADTLIFEMAQRSEYSQMREALIRFSDY